MTGDLYSMYSGKREEVAHSEHDCASGGSQVEHITPSEARDEGYTPCLECCPEGWPDE